MPAYVSVFGYASLVPQLGKPIRNGRRRKKNSKACWKMPAVYRWATDKFTSSSAAPAVACECARQPRTRAAACDTSVPHVCGVESLSSLGNRVRFMR